MSELVYPAPLRALDANGNPVAAAEATFFRTDTTTPLTVYADDDGSTAHPSPLVADANGVFPPIFNTSAFGVKVDIKDPLTSASLPGYPINLSVAASIETGAASQISFAPTAEIDSLNVQAAIVKVQANWTGAKTGEDAGLVSGTAGSSGRLAEWNADGDLVEGPVYARPVDPTALAATTPTVPAVADIVATTKEVFNVSGTAPMFACRAWVNFNGTSTVAIRASGNVSSITDNGVGDYTVNFTTAMPDVDYATLAGGGDTASSLAPSIFAGVTRAVGTCQIRFVNAAGDAIDRSEISFAAVR